MTLIEFYSESLAENIMSCLRLQPDKMVLLGDGAQMHQSLERCRTILQKRGMRTRITPMDTQGKNLPALFEMLSGIIRREDQCIIDLAGGDEMVIMAVGALVVALDEKLRQRVSVQRFDPQLGRDVDCDCDGHVIRGRDTSLTVAEYIYLYGGIVHPSSYQPDTDLTPKDLDPLWSIVADAPREWNKAISSLNEFESRSASNSKIRLSLEDLSGKIKDKYEEKKERVLALLEKFRQRGVITDRSHGDILEYSYTSPILRYCTQKAGNVLEVKTLLEARALKDNGAPFFRDCQTSVHIDWDGVVHSRSERVPETRNEIDLILTRGMTPLFISCKNGSIDDEELYKLNTVATRFGGPHVRKMLIAADLEQENDFLDLAYSTRAQDMGIYLVTDAAKLTKNEWRQIFKSALQTRPF